MKNLKGITTKKMIFAAASIMYEQAFRLMQYNTMEALEKQVKCYLAAINSLNLCEKKFAWVLRPADPDLTDEEIVLSPLAGSDEVSTFSVNF